MKYKFNVKNIEIKFFRIFANMPELENLIIMENRKLL